MKSQEIESLGQKIIGPPPLGALKGCFYVVAQRTKTPHIRAVYVSCTLI